MNASNNKYSKNIHKRGLVDIHAKEKSKYGFSVGPVTVSYTHLTLPTILLV